MTSELSRFQNGFVQALLAPHDNTPHFLHALIEQPGFSVYRNTVMKGCIDALQANYPTVLRMVGEEWFRAVAALHVRERPPSDTRLQLYGVDFPVFLRNFPPAHDLPYLPGVALLDRFWTEAHVAADAVPLEPAALANFSLEQLGQQVLQPHPAARWKWFEDQPIFTLWENNRRSEDESDNINNRATKNSEELIWIGQGALLTRPASSVTWTKLDAADCAFLDACAAQYPLAHAASEALALQPNIDLAQLIARLLGAGAFCNAQTCVALLPF